VGPTARPLGKVAFVHGLEPPGDALDQVLLVERPRRLAEDLGVALAELRDRHAVQRLHGRVDINGHSSISSSRVASTRLHQGKSAPPDQGRFARILLESRGIPAPPE
jgi:hypothetical protein